MDMNSTFTPSVALAVEQIKLNFPSCDLQVTPDGNGGGWFMLQKVVLGEPYANELIWMGGDLSAQLPYADLYPVFVSAELRRVDGKPLGEAIAQNANFHGLVAVQISRRSNHRDAKLENPAIKLRKVLSWLKSR